MNTTQSVPGPTDSGPDLPSLPRDGEALSVESRSVPAPPKVNRLPDYLSQIEEYWFRGPLRRFARDAGISEATFNRIFHGVTNPRYGDVCKIVALLEEKLGKKLDPRDVYEL